LYTTAVGFIQCGSTAEAVNNTGELVKIGHIYSVQADLGGGENVDATVRVYATQETDGSGDKVLLTSVNRVGEVGDGYDLFTVVGEQSDVVGANLEGYYVQVVIGGPYSYANHYLGGNYDNIVVTSKSASNPVCGDVGHPYPAGDINKDCYVGTDDISALALYWFDVNCSEPGWCNGADLNQDTSVNLSDFAVLAPSWLDCSDPMAPCCCNP
jgi:hypothetical protein